MNAMQCKQLELPHARCQMIMTVCIPHWLAGGRAFGSATGVSAGLTRESGTGTYPVCSCDMSGRGAAYVNGWT
jgi:hypothetical protein